MDHLRGPCLPHLPLEHTLTFKVAEVLSQHPVADSRDGADVVAFLASDDARWVSGQTLHVNGGIL